MEKIKEKAKQTWESITLPDNLDKDYDERCDNAFNKMFDRFMHVCYTIFVVFSTISIYFFITRELLWLGQ